MPTARGYLVGITSLALLTVGRAFGTPGVEQLGFGLLVLVLIAVGVVRLGRHDLTVQRRLNPVRVGPGGPVTVTVEVKNEGRGSAPLLLLEDHLPAGLAGSARFALHGIEADGHRSTSFVLRAGRRGSYEVGPLQISFVDPFSLARVRWSALGSASFLVHPPVETLAPPRDSGERRSLTSSARRQPTGARGEDFYTLRDYVEGDDLRKIHWPATAKRGRYMIRQEETPWHTRATIILDDRAEVHDGYGDVSSFERAVAAAASLCDLYARSGYGWRLATACGGGLPVAKGSEHLDRCLDLLATVESTRAADEALLARLAEVEATGSVEAALVVVTGTLSGELAVAASRYKRRFRQVSVISFPAHRFGSQATKSRWGGEQNTREVMRLLARSDVRGVVLGPDESLAIAWSAAGQPRSDREVTWGRRPELV